MELEEIQEKLIQEKVLKIPNLLMDYKVTMKLNEEISMIPIVSPSPDIKIKITNIYERPIRFYE